MSVLWDMAMELSDELEPPAWRVFARRHWRDHEQPNDIYEVLIAVAKDDGCDNLH